MFEDLWNQISAMLAGFIPSLVGAIALLIVGWLIARGVSSLVRKALSKTTLDDRLAGSVAGRDGVAVGDVVGRIVFWVVMILVIMGVLQVLGLTLATGPLDEMMTRVLDFVPQLAAAAVLLFVAWVVATVLRLLVRKALETTGLDEKVGEETGSDPSRTPVARALADATYWLVFLFFLPAILEALRLEGLMSPVQGMIAGILAFLPNIVTAVIILAVGWFLARILQRIVKSVLVAVGADRLADRLGMGRAFGTQGLSGVLSMVAYVLVLVPVLIASLNALRLDAITEPASNMLNMVLTAIPALFAAVLLLGLAYAVGSFLSSLLTTVLAGSGLDSVASRLGWSGEGSGHKASSVAGTLILVAVMLFAGIEALRLVGFHVAADLVSEFLVFAGHVALGLVIFGVGLYLGNLAARTIRESRTAQAALLATAARASIIVLGAAMGLREMGVGEDIVRLAFGLLVGAIAVATAVAFGIGGRGLAQRKLEQWASDVESRTGDSGN